MEDKRGLVGYVDADGASQLHRRAISGYVFMVDGGAVSWSSKKQELVTLSTAEAEYVPHTHAAKVHCPRAGQARLARGPTRPDPTLKGPGSGQIFHGLARPA